MSSDERPLGNSQEFVGLLTLRYRRDVLTVAGDATATTVRLRRSGFHINTVPAAMKVNAITTMVIVIPGPVTGRPVMTTSVALALPATPAEATMVAGAADETDVVLM
jgi:hypothetical protein